jgi:hypothetical protein
MLMGRCPTKYGGTIGPPLEWEPAAMGSRADQSNNTTRDEATVGMALCTRVESPRSDATAATTRPDTAADPRRRLALGHAEVEHLPAHRARRSRCMTT